MPALRAAERIQATDLLKTLRWPLRRRQSLPPWYQAGVILSFSGHIPPIYYIGGGYQNETQQTRLDANRSRDYEASVLCWGRGRRPQRV